MDTSGIEVRELPPRLELPTSAEMQASARARASEIQRAYARGRGDGFVTLIVGAMSGGVVGLLVGALFF